MPLEARVLLSVSLSLEVPPSSSYGVTNSVVIQYTNTGSTDAPAPLLVLSADNANIWLPTDPAASGANLQVLATNPEPHGPAGTLAPGARGSIVVDFTSTTSTSSAVNFSLGQLTPGQTINWASLQPGMQPSYITTSSAWNAVFANFTANVGSTTDSYQAVLDADATYLAQIGEPTKDVAQLVAYEIAKADNDFGTPALGGSVDLSVPTPGPDLSIARSFQPTVSGRNETGLFGLGWVSNWDIEASTDSYGNVTINEGGGLRYFALQGDGSYLASAGDTGTLTALSGGGYQLTEIDGSLTTFNANRTLNYVQDSNGNRITAGYNSSGQLISLTESDGDALMLTYNSQGFVSQVTDPSGETAKYTYDSAGHLLSVTTPLGTTTYSYVASTGTAADNALQTILNPDGTQLNYTYDREGRLTESFYGTAANPIEPVRLGYLSPGGVTYTDADGSKTTVLYTDLGQAAVITDSLGNTTRLSYDANGDLLAAALPGGTTYTYSYDTNGDLLSETDALGNTTTFTYDAQGNLTSYTDAKGNTTSYAYDSNDDLLSVTYANGDKQQYSYNPLGEATQFINARGQAIGYTYNTKGQITKETFADGTSYSYTYDAHGNLTSATDAQGRVTKFIYGGDPNNPNNDDLLTEVEYPDGTYLKFTYYAGGNRKQSVDETGYTVNYTYDAAGNLTELTDGNGNLIAKYTYDAAGSLIQQDNGNGTRTVYTFDAAGNVLSITNLEPDHTTINSFDDYTYDALGNVLTDTNQDGEWAYTYDADSQLIKAVFTPNDSDPDEMTAQNIQYAYDAAGNRTSETVNGVTTTYVVNNVNEYTSSTTNGVTTNYKYDPDGNLIAQTIGSDTTNYTYNELSELTEISGTGLTASYVSDPLGDRVSQTVNEVTTNFQVDPASGIVAAFGGTGAYNNSGGLLAHYTYGRGLISQLSASGTAGYYDFDLTGNTVGITNAAGSYVNKYSYLPFGQTTAIAAALPNLFTFVGQDGVMQDASNLFDMGAREYAAGTGQFLSNDPLGLNGGDVNIRRYVGNNPIGAVDPAGTDQSPVNLLVGSHTDRGFKYTYDPFGRPFPVTYTMVDGASIFQGSAAGPGKMGPNDSLKFFPSGGGAPVPVNTSTTYTYGGYQPGTGNDNIDGSLSTTKETVILLTPIPQRASRGASGTLSAPNQSSEDQLDCKAKTPPKITTKPSNQTVTAGQTATFTAAAAGYPSPTVQWEVSPNYGESWSSISGATSTTLTLTSVTTTMSGYEYEAVFTNSAGTATTNAATLTVNAAALVNPQPQLSGQADEEPANDDSCLGSYLDDTDTSAEVSGTTDNSVPSTTSGVINGPVTEGIPSTFVLETFVDTSGVGASGYAASSGPWTAYNDPSISVPINNITIIPYDTINPSAQSGVLAVVGTATFPTTGGNLYQGNVTIQSDSGWKSGPTPEAENVNDAPWIGTPVNFSVPASGGEYNGPVAIIQDTWPGGNTNFTVDVFGIGQVNSTNIVKTSGGFATVYADITFGPSSSSQPALLHILVYPQDSGDFQVFSQVTRVANGQPQFTSLVVSAKLMTNASKPADPPLAIIDTTDPSITSASQVSVSVGTPSSANTPIPLVTGTTVTHLPGGVTQIEIDGVISTMQPGAGPVAAAPLNITIGNEPTLTAQIVVNQALSEYVVNPANVVAVAGQTLQNVQVATVAGPANGSYSATINWGDGDTSTGVITALGGGQFSVTGSKPHPYAATGTDTITVTVNGPGPIPAPAIETIATVVTSVVSPPPSPPPSSPPPPTPPSPPSPPPPPHPAPPQVPPLLSFLNALLAEIETVNATGTTITDSFFGIPLVGETYDYSGNLVSATLFGINITAIVESFQ